MNDEPIAFEYDLTDPQTGEHLGRVPVTVRQLMRDYSETQARLRELEALNRDRKELINGLHKLVNDHNIDAPAGTRLDIAIAQYIEQLQNAMNPAESEESE